MTKGFDTATPLTKAQAQKLVAMGYEYAIRYLVPPASYSKALTKKEAQALSDAGLLIGCVWETTAARAKAGAAAGYQDGYKAKQCAVDLSVPTDAVIYFAVDYDAQANDYLLIASYMKAAADAIAPYKLGVYGSYYVVEEMHSRGVGEAYWQCVGWSGGKTSAHKTIYQKEWNVKTGVVTVDNNYLDDLKAAGLWNYKELPMVFEFTPKEMGIYYNSKRKKINDIQKELGCDVLCNLNLFNGDFTGACYTRSDNRIVGNDGYAYYGFGFDKTDRTLVRGWSSADKHANFFGCYDVMVSGELTTSDVPAWTNGQRRRTVVGTKRDGKIFIYANETPETMTQLRKNLLKLGAVEAVCLDGGGSTQLICPDGKVVSSDKTPRIVHTLFWANLSEKPKDVCPYNEPTANVRYWSIGEGAKWTQWQLNRFGYGLTVDGIFGAKSVAALKDFQKNHGLTVDGISGTNTRKELKK